MFVWCLIQPYETTDKRSGSFGYTPTRNMSMPLSGLV